GGTERRSSSRATTWPTSRRSAGAWWSSTTGRCSSTGASRSSRTASAPTRRSKRYSRTARRCSSRSPGARRRRRPRASSQSTTCTTSRSRIRRSRTSSSRYSPREQRRYPGAGRGDQVARGLLRERDAHADPVAVPVSRGDVHVHARDGRRARHLPRGLADDRERARRIRERNRGTPVRRVLHRLDARPHVQHRLHAVRLGVADPRGRVLVAAPAPHPSRPLRHGVVRRAQDPVARAVLADLRRPVLRLRPRARPVAARGRRVPRRDLGRLRHPVAEPLRARDDHDLHDARGRDLPGVVPDGAPRLGPARPAAADAALGAVDRELAAVQVDVLLPDRVARRKHVDLGAPHRPRLAGDVGRRRRAPRVRRLPARDPPLHGGRQLMRALSLAWTYVRLGVLNELQYRANFFVAVFQSLLGVAVAIAVLALVYSHTDALNGWSQAELLVVLGVQILLGGVIHASVQPNMERLTEEVRDGKLDFALTKPADSQLLVSLRELRLWQLVDVVSGATVVGVGVSRLETSVGVGDAFAFLALLLLGASLLYCFW